MDHFSNNPDDDIMFSMNRRREAARCLEGWGGGEGGGGLSEGRLWELLSRPPIWNDITTYGCLMCPVLGS